MSILNFKNNNKWFALAAGITLAAVGAPSAEAATYNLDFDTGVDGGSVLTDADGLLVTTQWADWGLTDITGFNDRTNSDAKLNLYNTDAGGQDPDLQTGSPWGTESQGNALIIQEENRNNKNYFNNNGVWRADDEAKGGYIDFDFDKEIAFTSFSLLDIDDNGSGIRFEGFNDDGSVVDIDVNGLIDGTKTYEGVSFAQLSNDSGDNSMYRFELDDAFLTSVRVSYPGSGAISNIEWSDKPEGPQEIPEPSAIGGLLMLGAVGTRKYLQRKAAQPENA